MAQPAAPFRRMSLQCPRCRSATLTDGPLHHCQACTGTWIEEQTLHEHVGTMRSAPPSELTWSVSTDRQGLPCALCQRAMEPLLLFMVPVDRCQQHGVWFDKHELARVLERAATPATAKKSSHPVVVDVAGDAGLGVAAEVGAEVGGAGLEVAAEAGWGVAEAGAGVAEAILDVIGGIFSAIDL